MTKTKWIIWSLEHRGWWMKNHTGYTQKREEAGEYSYEEALQIVRGANIGEKDIPNEAMIMECAMKGRMAQCSSKEVCIHK